MKKKKVNIKDVAKEAGVSVVTVSRVLNNVSTVRQSSREKVQRAVDKLNYQPSAAAQSLARGKTNVIGLIIPDLSDPFIMKVVDEVDQALEARDYSLALSVVRDEEDSIQSRSNFLFRQKRVDGILMITPLFESDYVKSLQSKDIPFVILDNQQLPFKYPSIVVDNFRGGYDVTRYLIELGHKEIAYIGGPEKFLSAQKRGEGFQIALNEIGLDAYAIARGEYEVTTGFEITNQWIKEDKLPTAIFAGDDHIAFGVINALHMAGYKVPEDISVIGFDDHPMASQLKPFLTTVKQPAREMGQKGVEILFELMNNGLSHNVVKKLSTHLIERDSTAPPKKN